MLSNKANVLPNPRPNVLVKSACVFVALISRYTNGNRQYTAKTAHRTVNNVERLGLFTFANPAFALRLRSAASSAAILFWRAFSAFLAAFSRALSSASVRRPAAEVVAALITYAPSRSSSIPQHEQQ